MRKPTVSRLRTGVCPSSINFLPAAQHPTLPAITPWKCLLVAMVSSFTVAMTLSLLHPCVMAGIPGHLCVCALCPRSSSLRFKGAEASKLRGPFEKHPSNNRLFQTRQQKRPVCVAAGLFSLSWSQVMRSFNPPVVL